MLRSVQHSASCSLVFEKKKIHSERLHVLLVEYNGSHWPSCRKQPILIKLVLTTWCLSAWLLLCPDLYQTSRRRLGMCELNLPPTRNQNVNLRCRSKSTISHINAHLCCAAPLPRSTFTCQKVTGSTWKRNTNNRQPCTQQWCAIFATFIWEQILIFSARGYTFLFNIIPGSHLQNRKWGRVPEKEQRLGERKIVWNLISQHHKKNQLLYQIGFFLISLLLQRLPMGRSLCSSPLLISATNATSSSQHLLVKQKTGESGRSGGAVYVQTKHEYLRRLGWW